MPIQWSGNLTSASQLAGVIQGEAGSNPAAQFAVASTMYNRMSTAGPYLGGGSGDVTQVVTPTQFNGYNSSPNSNAQSLADALWNGQAPPGGSTGNAVFFAAPVQGNASWAAPGSALYTSANSTNIGGNYFSDTQGAPSANFAAPNYTGATVAQGPADSSSGLAAGSTDGSYLTQGGAADPYSGDYTSTYPNPNTAFATTSPSTTAPSTSSSTSGDTGTGTRTDVGLQQGTLAAIQSWITSLMGGTYNAFTQALTGATTYAGTMFASIQNWFVRAFLIIVGVIVLAIGLVHLMGGSGSNRPIVLPMMA